MAVVLERLHVASSVLSNCNDQSLHHVLCRFIFITLTVVHCLRVRATPHTHRHSSPRCPRKIARRNGSKVRQTTWEWTHLTISRKSLILSSNKEMMKSDIERILAFLNYYAFFFPHRTIIWVPSYLQTHTFPSL